MIERPSQHLKHGVTWEDRRVGVLFSLLQIRKLRPGGATCSSRSPNELVGNPSAGDTSLTPSPTAGAPPAGAAHARSQPLCHPPPASAATAGQWAWASCWAWLPPLPTLPFPGMSRSCPACTPGFMYLGEIAGEVQAKSKALK